MADDELRVRQLAYRIWEAEGRPEGQEQRHWEMALKIVAAERESGERVRPELEIEADDTDTDAPVRDDELDVEQDDMGLGSSGTRPPATDPEEEALADETPDRNLGREKEGVPVTQSEATSAGTPLPEESATVSRARKPRRSEDTVTTPNATDTSTPGRSAATRTRSGTARAGTKTAAGKEGKSGTKTTTAKAGKVSAKPGGTPRKPKQ